MRKFLSRVEASETGFIGGLGVFSSPAYRHKHSPLHLKIIRYRKCRLPNVMRCGVQQHTIQQRETVYCKITILNKYYISNIFLHESAHIWFKWTTWLLIQQQSVNNSTRSSTTCYFTLHTESLLKLMKPRDKNRGHEIWMSVRDIIDLITLFWVIEWIK